VPTANQSACFGDMLADVIQYRAERGAHADCDASPALLFDDRSADLS
jgi:hypothetical protein